MKLHLPDNLVLIRFSLDIINHYDDDDDDDSEGRALQSRLKQMRLTLGAYVSALICNTDIIDIIIIRYIGDELMIYFNQYHHHSETITKIRRTQIYTNYHHCGFSISSQNSIVCIVSLLLQVIISIIISISIISIKIRSDRTGDASIVIQLAMERCSNAGSPTIVRLSLQDCVRIGIYNAMISSLK